MKRAWVLVANGSRARLFEAEKPKSKLVEIAGFEAPAVRAHEKDITTDLPGETFDSHGQGRHAYSQPEDPKVAEMRHFAKDLMTELEKGAEKEAYERLYILASPKMLGMLREHLTNGVKARLHAEIDKDWTLKTPDEIRAQLPEYL